MEQINRELKEEQKLTLIQVQNAALEILKEISHICEENNLRYFLTYGTLIGAVRNGGIIPWDDDIDIMMPRPDYNKLVEYFIKNRKKLQPLELFDNTINSKYPHIIGRVSDNRFRLNFANEKDYGIGVFVDIYPLDGVGDNYKRAVKLIKKTKKLASFCFLTSRKHYKRDNTQSLLKMIIKFPAYVIAKINGNKHYITKLNKYSDMFDYDSSKYVACLVWPVGKKNGLDRDVFERELFNTKTIMFEDALFNIPVGYDKFLTVTYGNYMEPLPEKDRKTHHTYDAYSINI